MHPLANAGLSAAAVTVLTWALSTFAHTTIPADVASALVALAAAAVHGGALLLPVKAQDVVAAVTKVPEAPAASPINPSNLAAGH